MLIVEGPDGLGKTTLCEKLRQELHRLGFTCFSSHMGIPGEKFDFYKDYIRQIRQYTIQDRFHLGEFAYAPFTSPTKKHRIDFNAIPILDAIIKLNGGMTILITAQPFKVLTHTDSHFQYEQLIEVNERFLGISKVAEIDEHYLFNGENWPAENEEFVERVVRIYAGRQSVIERMKPWNAIFER